MSVKENEKFQVGQKVWVYDCPKLFPGKIVRFISSSDGALVKIKGKNIFYPLVLLFSFDEDISSLFVLMSTDSVLLVKNTEKVKKYIEKTEIKKIKQDLQTKRNSLSLYIYFSGDYRQNCDIIEEFVLGGFPTVKWEGNGSGFGSHDISFASIKTEEEVIEIVRKIRKNKKIMKFVTKFRLIDTKSGKEIKEL